MAEISETDVMSGDFVDALSAEIDRVFARLSVARGMGVLPDAKARLMAMVGPNPASFQDIFQTYASLALTTGAEGNTLAASDPGPLGVPTTVIARTAEDAARRVALWTGSASDAFDDFIGFFGPGGNTVGVQRLVLDYLHLAAEAHQRVYINSRMDLWRLVTSLDTGIDSSEDISSPGIAVTLTVIAAIASGGAAALATGIGFGALAATAIAAAGSSGAAIIGGHTAAPKEIDLDPHDKWTLRDSLLDLVETMEADLVAAEDTVRSSVRGFTARMDPMSETGRALIGPGITGPGGGALPLEWGTDGTASLPKSYLEGFVPPSETD